MEHEWKKSIQLMIDWIDEHIEEEPSLLKMSNEIGYSTFYCSRLFHEVVGKTYKKYLADRKITFVAMALRDSNERILDIAIKYGYSSQESLTRAFARRFGCTPKAYRCNPRPLNYSIKQQVLFHSIEKGDNMSNLRDVNVRVEHLPAHKYIGVYEPRAKDYMTMWQYHDCEDVTGIIDSMRHAALDVVGCHMAGWYDEGYFYGFGVPMDYDGDVPEGFEVREIPASDYLVFYHPAFDFVKENNDVMERVQDLAWNFDIGNHQTWWISKNITWNDSCQTYQRHFPEVMGYEILRPIKKC